LDVEGADLLLWLRIRQPLYLRRRENELLIADRINEYSVDPRCLSIARLELRPQGVDEAISQLLK
jgi:hypothetical protein